MRLVNGKTSGLIMALWCLKPSCAVAQEASGTTVAAFTGAALGAYSGAMLATVGSIMPCTQSYVGPACMRWSAVTAGAVAATGGALLGANDQGRLDDVATTIGVGFGVGVAGGLVVKALAERVGWVDVFTVGLIGGAIGSAPAGSLLGLAIGGGLGVLLLPVVKGFTGADAISVALAGAAIGGITQWMVTGIDVAGEDPMHVPIKLGIRF